MRTSPPGPPGHANAASWRRWLFPAAIAAGLVTLLALPRSAAPGMALSYTRFLADVSAGTVRAVTISPAGQVTGSLAGGRPFTTTIPVALGGNGLAGDLAAHHVQVTATTATAMSSSLLSVLTGLLPLLLFGGLLYVGIRKVLATQMVREFGISEAIGPVSYSGPAAGYPGLSASRGYSEHTQWLVDKEVAALLTKAETRARDLLTSHREALAQLTAALLEQETVTGDQVRSLAQAASPAL